MRIVAGAFRGRRIKAPEGLRTRPTSEKVREALFDILGPRLVGCDFLDLYAGTGAVGLEALSRGARGVIFVENGPRVLGVLRSNVEGLGDEAVSRARIVPYAADRALKILAAERFEAITVFCDPPYADARWPSILSGMRRRLAWAPGGLLVVEHSAKRPAVCPEGFEAGRTYRYGDTALSFYRVPEGSAGDDGSAGSGGSHA